MNLKTVLGDCCWVNVLSYSWVLYSWLLQEELQLALFSQECGPAHSILGTTFSTPQGPIYDPAVLRPWLYLSCSLPGRDAHGGQAGLQLGHVHPPVLVGVQPGEQVLVRFGSIATLAATVRKEKLPHRLVHGWTDAENTLLGLRHTHTHTHTHTHDGKHTHTQTHRPIPVAGWHFWFAAVCFLLEREKSLWREKKSWQACARCVMYTWDTVQMCRSTQRAAGWWGSSGGAEQSGAGEGGRVEAETLRLASEDLLFHCAHTYYRHTLQQEKHS